MAITLKARSYAKQKSNKHVILLLLFAILLSTTVSTLAQQNKSLGKNSDRVKCSVGSC